MKCGIHFGDSLAPILNLAEPFSQRLDQERKRVLGHGWDRHVDVTSAVVLAEICVDLDEFEIDVHTPNHLVPQESGADAERHIDRLPQLGRHGSLHIKLIALVISTLALTQRRDRRTKQLSQRSNLFYGIMGAAAETDNRVLGLGQEVRPRSIASVSTLGNLTPGGANRAASTRRISSGHSTVSAAG